MVRMGHLEVLVQRVRLAQVALLGYPEQVVLRERQAQAEAPEPADYLEVQEHQGSPVPLGQVVFRVLQEVAAPLGLREPLAVQEQQGLQAQVEVAVRRERLD